MGKGGMVLGTILIILAFGMFPFLLSAFDQWAYADSTTIAAITTGGGETAGNITLGSDLYDENLDSVIDIDTSNADDTPAPSYYNTITRALEISGLEESVTRSLTIEYRTPRDDDFLGTLRPVLPVFLCICLLGTGAAIAYTSYKRR